MRVMNNPRLPALASPRICHVNLAAVTDAVDVQGIVAVRGDEIAEHSVGLRVWDGR
jgi:hypothetical protein